MDKRHPIHKGYTRNQRRRIRLIRANEVLAPSSLVPQIMRSCAKNVLSRIYYFFFCHVKTENFTPKNVVEIIVLDTIREEILGNKIC
jgi:hypothetical protein